MPSSRNHIRYLHYGLVLRSRHIVPQLAFLWYSPGGYALCDIGRVEMRSMPICVTRIKPSYIGPSVDCDPISSPMT
jgi:hypothetical protein